MSIALVRGFLGQPGSGKTYMMSAMAEEWSRRNKDKTLYTTYELNIPGAVLVNPPFEDGVSILDASDGLLLIDEAALTFDSRMYQSTPIALLHKLMQIRKYNLELWWSTQHLEYVDKRLRLITFESFHCGSMAKLPWPASGFFATIRGGVKGRYQGFRYLRRNRTRDSLYDTYEIVQRASYMERKNGAGGTANAVPPRPSARR